MGISVVSMDAGKVVVESDCDGTGKDHFAPAFAELDNVSARRMAVDHAAANGVNSPACGVPGSPYPVDAHGEVVASSEQVVSRYRLDVPIRARLGSNIV